MFEGLGSGTGGPLGVTSRTWTWTHCKPIPGLWVWVNTWVRGQVPLGIPLGVVLHTAVNIFIKLWILHDITVMLIIVIVMLGQGDLGSWTGVMEGQSEAGVKQEWTWAGDGVSTRIGLGWRSRVGNGKTKSRVLTSKGYRSWMVELDCGSG